MPVTLCGPTTARLRRCGSVVMPTAMPISVSASVCSIGATRSLTGPSKRCRKAAVTRWGPACTCMGGVFSDRPVVVFVHPRVDVEDRHALPVDRHLDLLAARRVAEEHAERLGEEVEPERVLAVGRERVHHRDAAAGAERRALGARELRGGLRQAVGGLAGRAVGIANGQRGHLAGRPQVALHQRRRERLRVGDVVEAVADRVGRQQRAPRRRRRQAGPARRAPYSARFSRWNGRQPGFGFTAACSSMRASSAAISSSSAAVGGPLRRRPAASCRRAACAASSPPSRVTRRPASR